MREGENTLGIFKRLEGRKNRLERRESIFAARDQLQQFDFYF
jgi:hypothetical protein